MASIVSSASWRRRRNASIPGEAWLRRFFLAITLTTPLRTNVESDEDALFVRHVANQPAERRRKALDQRGGGDDLVATCERQILVDVDHFEIVQPGEMLVADAPHV